MPYTPAFTVGALLAAGKALGVEIEVVAGESGLDRRISVATIQKTGLALAGFDRYLRAGRVLVFGESEVRYLESLSPEGRHEAVRRVLAHDLPAILLTAGANASAELVSASHASRLPLLRTSLSTPVAITRVTTLLEDRLAPREMVHGVLLDILGLGVLVIGESGIGKSECALDLVVRGHRLVADDAVEIRRRAETVIIGTCPELTRHHMEVRGIGLINVREMFGVASTRASKRVELIVHLERWEPGREYERLGLDQETHRLLGVDVPMVNMPVAPGRNIAILVEVAARNQLLRSRGRHAARELVARADQRLVEPSSLADDEGIELEEER